jgi:exodeoxyribonuclease VII small subunit
MAPPSPQDEIAALSFEDALKQLEDIVRKLETGNAKLDEAIASYERGALLKRHCEKKLREAQARVEKIVVGADGSLTAEPQSDNSGGTASP